MVLSAAHPRRSSDIYTIAGDGTDGYSGDGGPATDAELSDPLDVAAYGSGGLMIADSGNGKIWKVTG
jgi:hypothetical protein